MYLWKLLFVGMALVSALSSCDNNSRNKEDKEQFNPTPGGEGCSKEADY